MTVTLYSVNVVYGGDLEIISVEAEEKPSTYRVIGQREGGGFHYNRMIRRVSLSTRGIAFSESDALVLFISKCEKSMEIALADAKRREGLIHSAEALLDETEGKTKCQSR